VYARDSVYYQAMRLGQLATIGLDLRLPERYVACVQAVTAEQVQAVARKYLLDTNLTVAVLDPLPIRPGAAPRFAPAGGAHGR
jgi:zinc protease